MAERTLHAAAMPFPSYQGTQAAVHAMADASHRAGYDTHLLTYAYGAFALCPEYVLHRLADIPRVRSLRAGPSLAKIALDAQMVPTLARIRMRLQPDVVIAHHVEAATAAVMAKARPLVFVAHTALGPELPAYAGAPGHRSVTRWLSHGGDALDRWLCRRADATAAIAPTLRDRLAHTSRTDVHYVPLPWSIPAPISDDERGRARCALGLDPDTDAILYAGNLDAYQDWERLVEAMAHVARDRPQVHLVVATESEPTPLIAEARRAGIAHRVHRIPLAHEADRRLAHAAADIAVVPRRTPGGLPIKLLDSLARGVPTVACPRATGGLSVDGVAELVADDDGAAMAAGITALLTSRETRTAMRERSRSYVATAHEANRFADALERILEHARR